MKREAAEIEREYGPFPEHAPVHGVTFDGEKVWFAAGDHLQAFDPGSGELTRALPARSDAGIAFDGKHLYQLASGQIQKLDPESGRIVGSIPAPSSDNNSGLAWAEGSLWLGRGDNQAIVELDPKTGKVLRTIHSDRFVTGVTFSDGELWHATNTSDEHSQSQLRHVDRNTGEVLECVEMPEGAGVSGLESDGQGRFFCGGKQTGKVRVVKKPKRAAS